MRLPEESVCVEHTQGGFTATTSLVDGPVGRGRTRERAIAALSVAVREHLRAARAARCEVPAALRVSGTRRALLVALFLLLAVAVPVLLIRLWGVLN